MTEINPIHIDNNNPLCVLGLPHSGKSNLLFYFASLCSHPNKYTLAYPKPVDGFINLGGTHELSEVKDAVVVIDEFTTIYPTWTGKVNPNFIELLQFAQHNNVKVIFATQMSHSITKLMSSFIPSFAIKQVFLDDLKNGSAPKNALKKYIRHPNITQDFVKIAVNEYAFFDRFGTMGATGMFEFPDMNIGKDYRKKDKQVIDDARDNDSNDSDRDNS